ncbi:hypothetical protein E3P91_02328 [Wallemia ichthyophaga]|nr:hypothetical protein E3P91_02328 [Wallemia ichthyophaga]
MMAVASQATSSEAIHRLMHQSTQPVSLAVINSKRNPPHPPRPPPRQKRQRRTASTALVLLGAADTSCSDREALLAALRDADSRIFDGQPLLEPDQLFAVGDVAGQPLSPSPSPSPSPSLSPSQRQPPPAKVTDATPFERVDVGCSDDDGDGVVDITDELREKHHKRCEYDERRIRKLEKEQLVHDRYKLQEKQDALAALELEDSEDIPEEVIALSSGISLEDRPLALELQQKLLYENDKMLQRYELLLKSDIKGRVYPKPQYSSNPSPFDVRCVGDKGTYSSSEQMRSLEQRVFKVDMQSPFRVRLKMPPSTRKSLKSSQNILASPLSRFRTPLTPKTPAAAAATSNAPSALSIAADARLTSRSQDKSRRKSQRSLVAFGVNIPNEIDKEREFSLVDAAEGYGLWTGTENEFDSRRMWEDALSCRERGEAHVFATTSADAAKPTVSLPVGTMTTPKRTLAGADAASASASASTSTTPASDEMEWVESPASPSSPPSSTPKTSREMYAQLSTPKRGKKRGRKSPMRAESSKSIKIDNKKTSSVTGRGRGRPPRYGENVENKPQEPKLKPGTVTSTIRGKGITYVYGKFRGRRKITDPFVLKANPGLRVGGDAPLVHTADGEGSTAQEEQGNEVKKVKQETHLDSEIKEEEEVAKVVQDTQDAQETKPAGKNSRDRMTS